MSGAKLVVRRRVGGLDRRVHSERGHGPLLIGLGSETIVREIADTKDPTAPFLASNVLSPANQLGVHNDHRVAVLADIRPRHWAAFARVLPTLRRICSNGGHGRDDDKNACNGAHKPIVPGSVSSLRGSRRCRRMPDGPTLVRRRVAMNARRLREERVLTQEAASERIDCSVQTLRRIEGARSTATIDFVAVIAVAYRIDVSALFAPTSARKAPRAGR